MEINVTNKEIKYPNVRVNMTNIKFEEWMLIDFGIKELAKNHEWKGEEKEILFRLIEKIYETNETIKNITN